MQDVFYFHYFGIYFEKDSDNNYFPSFPHSFGLSIWDFCFVRFNSANILF